MKEQQHRAGARAPGKLVTRLKYSLGILMCLGCFSQPILASEILTVALPDENFRPLPALATDLRLTGEADFREWPVYLTAFQSGQNITFEAALTSAVSVMPEGSLVSVTVNNKLVHEQAIEAFGKQQLIAFDVPAGAFKPGYNVVRLHTHQRHRVSCETAATYELWSEIDSSRTGLRFESGDLGINSFQDIAALAPDHRGAVRLRAVLGASPSAQHLSDAVRILSAVAVKSGFTYPFVEVVGSAGTGSGLDLFIGNPDELTALGAPLLPEEGTLAVAENGTSVSLVVHTADKDSVEALVRQILHGQDVLNAGSKDEGQQALSRAIKAPVKSGAEISLSDLGAETVEFNGRLLQTSFDLRLPEDFYPVETGSIELSLAGGYSPELSENSQIVVRVNGEIAAGMPLARESGEVFEQKKMRLSLAQFRPGMNSIEISTQLINQQDEDCDTLALLNAPPRFLLLDNTTVKIPDLPRLRALPSLNASLAGGKLGANSQESKIYIPFSDPGLMSAAGTLAVRLALDTEGKVPADISFGRPDKNEDGAIILGSHADLPISTMKRIGLAPERIRTAWSQPQQLHDTTQYVNIHSPVQRRMVSLQSISDQEPITTASIGSTPSVNNGPKPIVLSSLPRSSDDELVGQWQERVDFQWKIPAAITDFSEILTGSITVEPAPEEEAELGANTVLVVAQGSTSDENNTYWTVFTSPSATILALSMQDIVSPHRWRHLRGKEARYDMVADTIEVTSVPPSRYVVTQPYSVTNWRLVIAGWLSRNPLVYAGALLIAAGFVAFSTRSVLSLNERGRL